MPEIRRRIFVGCEGSGERSLTVTLQRFARDVDLPIHVEAYDARGGSPLKVLRKSIKESTAKSKKRGAFDGGVFVLVDQDRIDADCCERELILDATRKKINLVRQRSSLECLLGRLLSGNYTLGEARAISELNRRWPDYDKSFDAPTLQAKLDLDRIRQSYVISEDWYKLLKAMLFVP